MDQNVEKKWKRISSTYCFVPFLSSQHFFLEKSEGKETRPTEASGPSPRSKASEEETRHLASGDQSSVPKSILKKIFFR